MAKKPKNDEPVLLEHEYDGIQEYDQRLPNWWLFTLYGAIVFSVAWWFLQIQAGIPDVEERLMHEMRLIEQARLAQSFDVTNNDLFWERVSNPDVVAQGEALFMANCKVCHGADLTGGIGLNLVDNQWKHGHQASDIYRTIWDGVPDKGMQPWGNQLGQQRIAQIVAFILSHHGDRATMEANATVQTD